MYKVLLEEAKDEREKLMSFIYYIEEKGFIDEPSIVDVIKDDVTQWNKTINKLEERLYG